jgi:hypothetical protein
MSGPPNSELSYLNPMNGTRQQRLSDPAKIRERVKEFLDKKINIVLSDNRAVFGVLKEVTSDNLVVENMRLKKISYRFEDVAEIYFDTIS